MFPSFYQHNQLQQKQQDYEESQYMLRLQYLRNEQLKHSQHIQPQHFQYFRPQYQPNVQRSQSYQNNMNHDSNRTNQNNLNRPSRAESTYYAHQAIVKQIRNSSQQQASHQRVQKPAVNVTCQPKEIKWPEKGSKLAITGKSQTFKTYPLYCIHIYIYIWITNSFLNQYR